MARCRHGSLGPSRRRTTGLCGYVPSHESNILIDLWLRRPGFGGSDSVRPDLRVRVWLETVPVLLGELGIEHVSLFCHSAGSIYLLNTLNSLGKLLIGNRKLYKSLIKEINR